MAIAHASPKLSKNWIKKFEVFVVKGHLTPFCACAAVWFLIRRNSFQSWYLWQKSFSIDLTRRVKVVTPTLKDCLVIYVRFKRLILWFELNTIELRFFSRGVFEAARDENYCTSVAVLFRKKKNEEKMGGRASEICIQEREWSVCICIQPSHNINMIDILCKQKVKCQWIKRYFERHMKLHADSQWICGARDSVTIFIGQKNWFQSRPHMHFIVTIAL